MIGQGKGPFLMIAARFVVACSGVWPPERKTMPARSAGTWFLRVSAVLMPISSGVGECSYCLPAMTMLHLSMQERRLTWWSASLRKRTSRMWPVTSAD